MDRAASRSRRRRWRNRDAYDRSVTHLRKTFSLAKTIQRARLYASAFGVYEITINGKRAGAEVLAPGYTDYEKRVLFQILRRDVAGAPR